MFIKVTSLEDLKIDVRMTAVNEVKYLSQVAAEAVDVMLETDNRQQTKMSIVTRVDCFWKDEQHY